MKQSIIVLLAMLAICASCDNSASDHSKHGLNLEVFHPYVEIMEKMDKDMSAMPSQHDADRDFAAMMKMHHQGAVEMAEIEIRRGTDATMKSMAQKILAAQKAEIGRFNALLQSGEKGRATDSFVSALHHHTMKMTEMAKQPNVHDPDVAFAAMMIPHHQSAIDMATVYLKYATNPILIEIARNIIKSQQEEIESFQRWLNKHDEHDV